MCMYTILVLACSSFTSRALRCDAEDDASAPDPLADAMVNDRMGRSMTAAASSKTSSSSSSSERGIDVECG